MSAVEAEPGRRAHRPVLLAVDDDVRVLRAVVADLRSRYASRYRILQADSGETALATLQELAPRAGGTPVALVLADQRMPGLTGVELLQQARDLFPEVKAVLLTAYADTDVAIEAINRVRLDYYIQKPWQPPEDNLYPALDDLLEDWQASASPAFDGLTLVGHRWSPHAHLLRDFLTRNLVPFRWLDVETDDDAQRLLAAGGGELTLPAVLLPEGGRLADPSPVELAAGLGLHIHSDTRAFDLLIVGAGPAGLAAAVYGASEGLTTGLIEREAPGGQAGQSSRIENYLGFPAGVSGADLTRRALAQARKFDAEVLSPVDVVGLETCDPYRVLHLADGSTLTSRALILATGVSYRRLPAEGVDDLTGAGVYYGGARTEALACAGEDVLVVGGANSAGQAALHFAQYASTVTMLVREPSLHVAMSSYLVHQIEATPNIQVRLDTVVLAVRGREHLESVTVAPAGGNGSGTEEITAPSLFVFIGAQPRTGWLEGTVARDAGGFIPTGPEVPGRVHTLSGAERDRYLLETSVAGVFAVGDVRARSVKRVASAVGEGSVAVQLVHQYLAQ